MKWNADTGSFEAEREDGMLSEHTNMERVKPHAPPASTPARPKNPSPDNFSVILDALPSHILYDDCEYPRTIPEAEARIFAALAVECISSDLLHRPPYSAYQTWTEAQQQRFRKAEISVALRLLRLAGRKHPAPEGDDEQRMLQRDSEAVRNTD